MKHFLNSERRLTHFANPSGALPTGGLDGEIKKKEGVTILHVSGNLDADSVAAFKKSAYKILEESKPCLVMDCSSLDFVDSMGLGAMISLLRRVRTQRGDLKIAGLNADVRSVFEITRLHHLFDVLPDWESACQKF